jgi:hypothetical protein
LHRPQYADGRKRSRRCELLFVTAYSPDFSPIKQAFSKINALRRGLVVPMCEALLEAVAMAVCAMPWLCAPSPRTMR